MRANDMEVAIMAIKSTVFQEIQRECETNLKKNIDAARTFDDLGTAYYYGWKGKEKDLSASVYCYTQASELGNCDSMKRLANIYETGRDIPQNMDRAIEFYEMAADAGDVEAMKKLGKLYACGKIDAEKSCVKLDGTKAVAWYEKAVSNGDKYAMESLGDLYQEGSVVKKSLIKAAEWYQKILDTDAWYPMKRSIMEKLVRMYEKADSPEKVAQWRDALEKAERKYHEKGRAMSKGCSDGFEYYLAKYKKLAESGDRTAIIDFEDRFFKGTKKVNAFQRLQQVYETRLQENADVKYEMFLLGKMYRYGRGTNKDLPKAFDFLMKASNLGLSDAMLLLGDMYANGIGVEQDGEQAVAWMEKAADAGNDNAWKALGDLYAKGQGISVDLEQAARWYKKTAEPEKAMYHWGIAYAEGKGVAPDAKMAVEWFRKAAEEGHSDAMTALGNLYAEGYCIPQDLEEAVRWYQKAAKAGNLAAVLALAHAYENGKGVPRDSAKAMALYRSVTNIVAPSFMIGGCIGGTLWDGFISDVMAQTDGNTAYGMMQRGYAYEHGKFGVKQDKKEAMKWYRKAADAGESYAMFALGNAYASGEERDEEMAFMWYHKGADAGLP